MSPPTVVAPMADADTRMLAVPQKGSNTTLSRPTCHGSHRTMGEWETPQHWRHLQAHLGHIAHHKRQGGIH